MISGQDSPQKALIPQTGIISLSFLTGALKNEDMQTDHSIPEIFYDQASITRNFHENKTVF